MKSHFNRDNYHRKADCNRPIVPKKYKHASHFYYRVHVYIS